MINTNQEMMAYVSNWIWSKLKAAMLKCMILTLSIGPIPHHVAFIMDGNRRYAKQHNLKEGLGHKLGLSTLISRLGYCYKLGIRHVTIYAFSIDNFKRRREEVETLMELIRETMESWLEEDSFMFKYGVRVHVAGDLTRLHESVRLVAERLMEATLKNSNVGLSICIAYTSTDEILRAVQMACEESLVDDVCLVTVERKLDFSGVSDPDIIIRTSGETRLSNFLLWQGSCCLLYSPSVEWPEFGVRHLVWAILSFQRMYSYFESKKKQL